jgi:uncharacterized protein (TIGR00645 family)
MNTPLKRPPRAVRLLESVLFNVKWILPVFYLGLAVVLLLYGVAFGKEIWNIIPRAASLSTDEMKIVVLDFVDLVMVASLVKMIITGSYNSFVNKDHGRANENISSGMLKIKISTSIIVVCSIHLLRTFVAEHSSWEDIQRKLCIYAAFLISALVLGVLEYLHQKGEALEKEEEHHV